MSDPKQVRALCDALRRYLDWREFMAKLREEKKFKRRAKKAAATSPTPSPEPEPLVLS